MILWTCCWALPVGAQITLDGTLGTSGSLHGPNFRIGAEVGQQKGGNLFHSFFDFNVHTGESATFTGPPSVQNIIGRVTGPNASDIDGRIASEIPGADLFLLNPRGIMFGPNASLDVQGSFAASTAGYVRLSDGGRFDAVHPQDSVLTTAPPVAFGFLDRPAALTLDHSHLEVPETKSLTLTGGGITMTGGLVRAPDGRILLSSVAGAGEVAASPEGSPPSALPAGGDLTISDAAAIDSSGESGGGIVVRGGDVALRGSTITAETTGAGDGAGIDVAATTLDLRDGATIESGTSGSGRGGNVDIAVEGAIDIAGENSAANDSGIFARSRSKQQGAGDAGAIKVSAGSLSITDGGVVLSSTFGPGGGGNVDVTVQRAIEMAGADSQAFASGVFAESVGDQEDAGDAGAITVRAGSLSLADDGTISSITTGPGKGGNVEVAVQGTIEIAGKNSQSSGDTGIFAVTLDEQEGAGDAGAIAVSASSLSLTSGGQIKGSTFGPGKGGNVTLAVEESIDIAGEDSRAEVSGIFADSVDEQEGAGDAGAIAVRGGSLSLTDGGKISSSTAGSGKGGNVDVAVRGGIEIAGEDSEAFASGIFAEGLGKGDAGGIGVHAGSLSLADGGEISCSTGGLGKGGSIQVTVQGAIEIAGEDSMAFTSGIFAIAFGQDEQEGAGDAGAITVRAGSLHLIDGGAISSSTLGPGNGGSIDVGIQGAIEIAGENSKGLPSAILAQSQSEQERAGDAGAITVRAGSLRLTDGGAISSSTFGTGEGGSIDVGVQGAIEIVGAGTAFPSGIFATSADEQEGAGDGGAITVSAGLLSLTDGGQISSSTGGPGKGGSVDVAVRGAIEIAGADSEAFGSGIFASSSGVGDSGSITLTAGSLQLKEGGVVEVESTGSGKAGDISITAEEVALLSGASLNARSASPTKPGGNIHIDVGGRFRAEDASVATAAATAEGGNIDLQARDIDLQRSPITANAGEGNGGNVTLAAETIVARDNSDISADARGGRGGNITVTSAVFIRSDDSDVTASSQFSEQGTTTINSPDTNLSSILARLPESYLRADEMLPEPCAARERSTFVVRGVNGVPAAPEDE